VEFDFERGERFELGAHLVGREVRACKKEAALGDSEWQHSPIADHVLGQRMCDVPRHIFGLNLSDREPLLEAERFIQRILSELSVQHQMLT